MTRTLLKVLLLLAVGDAIAGKSSLRGTQTKTGCNPRNIVEKAACAVTVAGGALFCFNFGIKMGQVATRKFELEPEDNDMWCNNQRCFHALNPWKKHWDYAVDTSKDAVYQLRDYLDSKDAYSLVLPTLPLAEDCGMIFESANLEFLPEQEQQEYKELCSYIQKTLTMFHHQKRNEKADTFKAFCDDGNNFDLPQQYGSYGECMESQMSDWQLDELLIYDKATKARQAVENADSLEKLQEATEQVEALNGAKKSELMSLSELKQKFLTAEADAKVVIENAATRDQLKDASAQAFEILAAYGQDFQVFDFNAMIAEKKRELILKEIETAEDQAALVKLKGEVVDEDLIAMIDDRAKVIKSAADESDNQKTMDEQDDIQKLFEQLQNNPEMFEQFRKMMKTEPKADLSHGTKHSRTIPLAKDAEDHDSESEE